MNLGTTGLAVSVLVTLVSACKTEGPSTTSTATSAETTSATSAPVAPAASGTVVQPAAASPNMSAAALRRFFPKDGDGGYKRVPSSEREGLVEEKLQRDGKDVATVTIVDAEKLVYQKAKFGGATDKVGGFPALAVGAEQSSVLVNDRFLVKIASPTLDHEARKAILARFDLRGLAGS